MPAITHQNIIFVILRVIYARVGFCPEIVGAVVFQFYRNGERQFPRRVGFAADDIGGSRTGLGTQIPRLHEPVDLREPRHAHGIAANQYDTGIGVHLNNFLDQLVLPERQVHAPAVIAFAILLKVFVEPSEEQDYIGFASHFQGLLHERVGVESRG